MIPPANVALVLLGAVLVVSAFGSPRWFWPTFVVGFGLYMGGIFL